MTLNEIQPAVDEAVRKLRARGITADTINDALAAAFTERFEVNGQAVRRGSPHGDYVEAIRLGFYTENNPLLRSDRREYIVLALLASQQAESNLGLHVLIALMVGIPSADVVNTIFLTGVYCGVNVLTKCLAVVAKAFAAIIAAASGPPTSPGDGRAITREVIGKVLSAFADPQYDAAKKILQGEGDGGGNGGKGW